MSPHTMKRIYILTITSPDGGELRQTIELDTSVTVRPSGNSFNVSDWPSDLHGPILDAIREDVKSLPFDPPEHTMKTCGGCGGAGKLCGNCDAPSHECDCVFVDWSESPKEFTDRHKECKCCLGSVKDCAERRKPREIPTALYDKAACWMADMEDSSLLEETMPKDEVDAHLLDKADEIMGEIYDLYTRSEDCEGEETA